MTTRLEAVQLLSEKMPPASDFQVWIEDLWNAGGDGDGITIAYADSGADLTDPTTEAGLAGGLSIAPGIDPGDLQDQLGHGGVVARIMLTLAPKAKLFPIRIFGAKGECDDELAVQGLLLALQHGDIVNASIGSSDPSKIQTIIPEFEKSGKSLVAAAGNHGDGKPEDVRFDYPAACEYAISVGAWDRGGILDPTSDILPPRPAYYSDPNQWVDVCAVGRIPGTWEMGTSFCAPQVTASLACWMSYCKKTGRPVSDASNYNFLLANSRQLPGLPPKDPRSGYGMVTLRPFFPHHTLEVDAKTGEATLDGQPSSWAQQPINQGDHLYFGGRELVTKLGGAVSYDPQSNRAQFRV